MASTKQLKHHTEFRSAVLRNLFASVSPPSTPKKIGLTPDSLQSSEIQIDGSAGFDHESFALSPLSIPSYDEEIYIHKVRQMLKSKKNDVTNSCLNSEESGTRKLCCSSVQQKRKKLKGLKERLDQTHETRRFCGPLLPDPLKQMSSNCISACQESIYLQQQGSDVCCNVDHKDDTCFAEEENVITKYECDSVSAYHGNTKPRVHYSDIPGLHEGRDDCNDSTQKGEKDLNYTSPMEAKEEDTCNSSRHMSKNKRRRLAKKHLQSIGNRHPFKSSIFSAEIKGKSIVVKKK